jgi:hypothetical protein
MDKSRAVLLAISIVVGLSFASFACNAFIGAGINLDKGFSHTINFDLGGAIPFGDTALGVAGLDVGVTYGVNYDLNALAGYPYGYGGVGSVTNGDLGYNLGVTVDATNGGMFNGADWGVPLTKQAITTTHLAKEIAENAQISDTQVALPFAGIS